MKNIGVYIHIPFCQSKCYYCDFLSFANLENRQEAYVNALVKEIKNAKWLKKYNIKSIFFGGGTPTVLSEKYLEKILVEIYKYYVNIDAEITIEANPGTTNKQLLKSIKGLGVNRLSYGLQETNDKILENIGRIHDFKMFLDNYFEAKSVGFDNINVDLMFALPNQTFENWQETLQKILYINPKHISAYSLIVEPNTVLKKMIDDKKIRIPDENTDRSMYSLLKKLLSEKGYQQYEISNFAKKGFQSVHNKIYWQREEYIGFGLGAHSFVNGERFFNTTDFDSYILGNDIIANKEIITTQEAMEEFIFLGLRMNIGISILEFQKQFNIDIFKIFGNNLLNLITDDYLCVENGRISLTDKGIDVSNTVFSKILT